MRLVPFGTVSDALVLEMVQNATEVFPFNVTVLNDEYIVADFPGDTDVYKVSQAIHGPEQWRNKDIKVNCLMSTLAGLISIEKEREEV